MLAGVVEHSFTYILCGIIWAIALGFAFGNYACSLVHRLPRGKPLLDKTPYCGSCGKLLGVKDLFPVVSALMLKHRCRYCHAPFPTSHTWTELLVGLLFVLAFLRYNFSEAYMPVVAIGTFLITLAAIQVNDHMLMRGILVCIAVSGMIFRTLVDHSLFGFVMGGLYGLLVGVALQYKYIKKVGHVYVPPPLAQLIAVGGICVGAAGLPAFLVLFAAFYLVSRVLESVPVAVPFGFAVIVSVLYPGFIPL